jgi:two-component system, OmpR family, osmolarity sensor histidine kinase EnvZ
MIRLWPRSLVVRNAALLALAITLMAAIATTVLFAFLLNAQLDRMSAVAADVSGAFSEAVEHLPAEQRDRIIAELNAKGKLEIRKGDERPQSSAIRANIIERYFMDQVSARIAHQDELEWFVGEGRVLWFRLRLGEDYYWIGARSQGAWSPLQFLVFTIIVSTAVIAVFSIVGSRTISRPLIALRAATETFDLDSDLKLSKIDGPLEVAGLAESFRAMAQRLQRAESVRAETLAALSHDLRTPLARLRLALEMMEGDPELKDGASKQIREIDGLVGQFLDYARGTAGEEVAVFDLAFLVADIAGQYRIPFTGPDALPFGGKRDVLRRALVNLIENARKYGAPPIRLALSKHGDTVTLEVQDGGTGFPPERTAEMVQTFRRGETVEQTSGTGLGLAIADRAARDHRGSLSFAQLQPAGFVARLQLVSAA